jgi:predicted ribosomally synthesized peptide with SipW-like signal peptide
MNSKLVKASMAGAAAIALAAGGGTYANWSDFQNVNGNTTAAGHLVLNVNDNGVDTSQNPLRLAPGENRFIDYYIASNDGQSVPNGQLSITLKNLVNHEDGCTSNSEAVAEGATVPGYDPSLDCGDNSAGNNNGELGSEARMEIIQYGPSANGQCSSVSPLSGIPNSVVQNFAFVNGLENVKIPVVQLTPGQATCVRAIVDLLADPSPVAADNKVQGDSMTWDFHFDLEQV